jgi:hypothetical protein
MQKDEVLFLAVFHKVMSGEPLTLEEVQRWGKVITTPFNVSVPQQQQLEQIKFDLRQELARVYEIKK